jgi:hypothetical protein
MFKSRQLGKVIRLGNVGFIIRTGQNSKLVKWQVDKMTWHRWIYSQEKFRDQSFAKSSPLYQIAKIDLFSFHHSPGGIITHSGKEQKLLFIFFFQGIECASYRLFVVPSRVLFTGDSLPLGFITSLMAILVIKAKKVVR